MTDDYGHVIEVLSHPTVVVKGDGRLLAANTPAARLFGVQEDLIGRSLQDFTPAPQGELVDYLHRCSRNRQALIGAFSLRIKGGEKDYVIKGGALHPHKDKAEAIVLLQLFPRPAENERFTELNKRILDLNREIHNRRLVEESLQAQTARLQEANRRVNEFLIMLAHELRNPLAPISNAVEILHEHHDLPGHTEKARDILARQVKHLTRMINDFLDISRILRGKNIIQRESLDLAYLVRNVCSDTEPQLRHSGQTLAVNLPPEPLWLEADPTRITQVLDNLLGNANKYTPAGGRVEVTLSSNEEIAVLTVADNGVGIDPALLPDLFEPFTQAEQTLARSSGGLGLGLSIVKGLVELHGGTVTAESPGKGGGATFTIQLPLKSDESLENGKSRDARRKILIIEDNPDTAETMNLLLGALGYEIHTAITGTEGLQKARHVKPDIIICDIGLPEMDGFTVAEKIRADPETASISLIALSGYGNENFTERARQVGFNLHLTKPVKIDIIKEAINSL